LTDLQIGAQVEIEGPSLSVSATGPSLPLVVQGCTAANSSPNEDAKEHEPSSDKQCSEMLPADSFGKDNSQNGKVCCCLLLQHV